MKKDVWEFGARIRIVFCDVAKLVGIGSVCLPLTEDYERHIQISSLRTFFSVIGTPCLVHPVWYIMSLLFALIKPSQPGPRSRHVQDSENFLTAMENKI